MARLFDAVNTVLTDNASDERMKMYCALVLCLVLIACGAQPAPEFFGGKRTDVTREGRSYTLFQKGNRVEIIRLAYARRGEHQAIRADMIELIPEVTGCKLVESSLQGDSGEMRGNIRC